jgi:alpha-D-ribose 1-methylphosphonate 5-triphosphate diphosphatase
MIQEKKIHLLSIMDHTPGQGQYGDVEKLKEFLKRNYAMTLEEIDENITNRMLKREDPEIQEQMERLIEYAREKEIPLASHDDDTREKVLAMKKAGIVISEFPVCLEAAHKAHEEGLFVIVGAPNIIQGGSNTGNLKAIDAISNGYADIISSDYLSAGILHALFFLHNTYGMNLARAVRMATLNPARAVGLDHLIGSLEPGKKADIIVVKERQGIPFVQKVFVHGVKRLERTYPPLCTHLQEGLDDVDISKDLFMYKKDILLKK